MPFGVDDLYESGYESGYKDAYNKGYNQGFKDGKECTLVSIDAIEDITDRMINIISEMDWEKLLKIDNTKTVEPTLSDEQIDKIADLLETEWGYEGIREDVSRILRGGRE